MCGFNKLLIPISLLFNWQSSSISWGQDQGQHRWPTGNRWERCGHRDSLPGEVERPAAVLWSTAVIWQVISSPLYLQKLMKQNWGIPGISRLCKSWISIHVNLAVQVACGVFETQLPRMMEGIVTSSKVFLCVPRVQARSDAPTIDFRELT